MPENIKMLSFPRLIFMVGTTAVGWFAAKQLGISEENTIGFGVLGLLVGTAILVGMDAWSERGIRRREKGSAD